MVSPAVSRTLRYLAGIQDEPAPPQPTFAAPFQDEAPLPPPPPARDDYRMEERYPWDPRTADQGPHEQPYPGTVVPIVNPDGSRTTERSITVTEPDLNQGRATNIPTVWSGRVVPDDEAVRNAAYSRRDFPAYDTIDDAVSAAEQRSRDLGAGRVTSIGGATPFAPEPAPSPPPPRPQYSGPSYAQPRLAPGQPSMLEQASNVVAGAGRGVVEGAQAGLAAADQALTGPKVTPPTWEDPLAPVREVGQHIAQHPLSVLPAAIYGEVQGAATDPIGRRAVEAAGGGTDPLFEATVPESVPFVGGARIAPSAQDVGGFAAQAVLDPFNYVGAAGAGLAGRGLRHVAAEAARGLPLVGESEALLRGGAGLVRRGVAGALAETAGQGADEGVRYLGSGAAPGLRAPLYNAAQGGVLGAASESLQAQEEGRDVDPATMAQRALIGGGLGVLAGSRAGRAAARRAGAGLVGGPPTVPAATLGPVGQRVMDAYTALTPDRVERVTARGIQVASDAIARKTRPGAMPVPPAELVQQVHEAVVRNLDDTKVVMTGLNPGALRAFLRGEGLTSKAETGDLGLINAITQGQVNVAGGRLKLVDGKRVKVPYTLEDAADFAQRESEQMRGVTGGTRFPDPETGAIDTEAPKVLYAYVSEGQPLVAPNRPTLGLVWNDDTPRVSSVNHPFGLLSRAQDIHVGMAEGNKALVYSPDAIRGARHAPAVMEGGRLVEAAPGVQGSGELAFGWEQGGIDVGGGRTLVDSDYLVGPEGESSLRATALVTGMTNDIQQAIATGKMTDPEQIAAVLMRGGSPQWKPGWGSVTNPTRTESLVLDPHLANVQAIYISGTPKNIASMLEGSATGGVGGGKGERLTELEMARRMRAAIKAATNNDVPIIFNDTTRQAASKAMLEAGASNEGWAPRLISDAQVLEGPPLTLSPGRGRIVDQYTQATDPTTGRPYMNIGGGFVPDQERPLGPGRGLTTPTQELQYQGRTLAVTATGDPAAPFTLQGGRGGALTLIPTGAPEGRRYYVQTPNGKTQSGFVGQLSDGSLLWLPNSGPEAPAASRIWRADQAAQRAQADVSGLAADPAATRSLGSGVVPSPSLTSQAGGGQGITGGIPPVPTRRGPPAPVAPPGLLQRFPGVQGALTASAQRAATMQARGLTPPSGWEWAKQLGYSGIFGPSTATGQVIGGALETGLAQGKEALRALTTRQGGRYGAQVAAQVQALPEAWDGFWDVVLGRGGASATAAASGGTQQGTAKLSERVVNPLGHAAARVLEKSGELWAEAPDAIFRPLFTAQGMRREADQVAHELGQGKAYADTLMQTAQNLRAHPGARSTSAEAQRVVDAGAAYADELGYKGDPGTAAAKLAQLSHRNDAVGLLASYAIPFPGMAGRTTRAALRSTPGVGLLPGVRAGRPLRGFDTLHDQALGAVALSAMGAYAANGGITGSGPADPEKRKQMVSEGWQPNSMLVGDHYVPNRLFQRFGPILNAVGEAHDTVAYAKPGQHVSEYVTDAGRRLGAVMTDQTGLSGLSDLYELFTGQGGLASGLPGQAARAITRYTPFGGTIRAAAQATDPEGVARAPERWSQREAAHEPGWAGSAAAFGESVGQQLEQNVPGLRGDVPAAQDTLGRPMPNPQQGLGAIVPRTTTLRDDPVISAFQAAGVDIGAPKTQLTEYGLAVDLTPDETRRWNTYRGEELTRMLEPLLGQPAYVALPPDQKVRQLASIKAAADERANTRLRVEIDNAAWLDRLRTAAALPQAS